VWYVQISALWAKMDIDCAVKTDSEQHLQVQETDDSCMLEYFEVVPLIRDTDGSCTTECVSGDWSADVKEEHLTVVKEEPDDVCYVIFIMDALCSRCGHHIFALWFLISFHLFSSPNLSRYRLDIYHTSTHGVALVRI